MFPWWPCATKTVPSASTSSAGSDSSSAGGSVSSSDDGSTRGNGFHPAAPPAAQMDPVLLRREMVERQLLKRGIRDERVVAAMLSVPRHEFVPAGLAGEAYSDRPLPIGFAGQSRGNKFMARHAEHGC